MPIVGNKRVSQLVELTAEEIQPNDLFLIIDVTARESKRIRASELEIYLQGSGSTVANAISASYVPGSGVDGFVALATTASFTTSASFASFANQVLNAISSSYSKTASFALNGGGGGGGGGSTTASYLVYSGFPNGTASYAIKALQSDVASTANFLSYFGGNNGTASYAITTQTALRTKNADTASYFQVGPGSSVSTASYAFVAEVANSGNSTSSSFLVYSPNNGTASYAMSAQKFANVITDQGIFLANTQSNIQAQLDDVDILWSTTGVARTPIEAFGTVKIPFTSSAITNGTVYLSAIDRNTGLETILDSTPITFNLSPSMGTYGNNDSGSVRQTFTLAGQASLYGSYLVFVSASNNLQIESTRTVRFNVASETDTFAVYPAPPIIFSASPSQSLFTFSSTDGPLFTDTSAGIVVTASVGKSIFTLNGINNGVTEIDFFWKLNNITASNISNNVSLSFLSGLPNTITYFSCSNCNLSSLYSLSSSLLNTFNCSNNILNKLPKLPLSMSYVDCSFNRLFALDLPQTMSYLNCSSNFITNLPATMSYGLTNLLMDNNSISNITSSFPDSIISMSINNNPLYNISSLPPQSQYLSFNNCLLSSLPSIPVNIVCMYIQSCSLSSSTIDSITGQLIVNGVLNGVLDIRGNGTLSPIATSNITILNSNGWTTLYDV